MDSTLINTFSLSGSLSVATLASVVGLAVPAVAELIPALSGAVSLADKPLLQHFPPSSRVLRSQTTLVSGGRILRSMSTNATFYILSYSTNSAEIQRDNVVGFVNSATKRVIAKKRTPKPPKPQKTPVLKAKKVPKVKKAKQSHPTHKTTTVVHVATPAVEVVTPAIAKEASISPRTNLASLIAQSLPTISHFIATHRHLATNTITSQNDLSFGLMAALSSLTSGNTPASQDTNQPTVQRPIPFTDITNVVNNTCFTGLACQSSNGINGMSPMVSNRAVGSGSGMAAQGMSDIAIHRVGLPNIGNTCYINSTIQGLLSVAPFVSHFMNTQSRGMISSAITTLIGYMVSRTVSRTHLRTFKMALESKINLVRGYQQQDAIEFIQELFEALHQEAPHHPNTDIPAGEWASVVHGQFNGASIITDLFRGYYSTSRTCSNCNHSRQDLISFVYLPLPLSDESSADMSINSLLDTFQQVNPLEDYKCDVCKQRNTTFTQQTIVKLPPHLILQLQRFNNGISQAYKDTRFVSLTRSIYNRSLSSVISHQGTSLTLFHH